MIHHRRDEMTVGPPTQEDRRVMRVEVLAGELAHTLEQIGFGLGGRQIQRSPQAVPFGYGIEESINALDSERLQEFSLFGRTGGDIAHGSVFPLPDVGSISSGIQELLQLLGAAD